MRVAVHRWGIGALRYCALAFRDLAAKRPHRRALLCEGTMTALLQLCNALQQGGGGAGAPGSARGLATAPHGRQPQIRAMPPAEQANERALWVAALITRSPRSASRWRCTGATPDRPQRPAARALRTAARRHRARHVV